MAKYSKKLVEVIVELIENDMSVTDVCRAVGITRKTFYEWKSTKSEFAQLIDEAHDRAYEELIALARRTLRDRIEGYTVEETTYTYEPASYDETEMVLKKKVVKQKRKEPSMSALMKMVKPDNTRQKKTGVISQNTLKKKEGLIRPSNSEEAFILANFLKKVEDGNSNLSATNSNRKIYNNV